VPLGILGNMASVISRYSASHSVADALSALEQVVHIRISPAIRERCHRRRATRELEFQQIEGVRDIVEVIGVRVAGGRTRRPRKVQKEEVEGKQRVRHLRL
jgi:hypothetical protein